MKILILGLGSIGQRHLNILNKNYDFDVYALRTCKGVLNSSRTDYTCLFNWQDIDKVKPDVALICNPTHLHIETAIKCIKHGISNLLIEKPLSDNLDNLETLLKLVDKNKVTAYVAYPFRHHPKIQELKQPYYNQWLHLVCHTDYRKWPSKRKSDGCLLELSHELDLAQYLLGNIKGISNSLPTIFDASLDIDTECWLRVEHCNKNLSFHNLAILAPEKQRFLKFRGSEKIEYSQNDLMYEKQLNYFFANLDNPGLQNNIFEAAELFDKVVAYRDKEGK
jgi:predicted dehydrogenase